MAAAGTVIVTGAIPSAARVKLASSASTPFGGSGLSAVMLATGGVPAGASPSPSSAGSPGERLSDSPL